MNLNQPTNLAFLLRYVESGGLGRLQTLAQLSALSRIDEAKTIQVSELAFVEHVRPATMSRMITALEQDGMIKRSEVKGDGRRCSVSVTTLGKRALTSAQRVYAQRIGEVWSE